MHKVIHYSIISSRKLLRGRLNAHILEKGKVGYGTATLSYYADIKKEIDLSEVIQSHSQNILLLSGGKSAEEYLWMLFFM